MLTVINDVLDLSKAEHGRMRLGSAPVHVDRLLDELRATFAYACTSKNVTFLTGREASVPRVVVGDPTRLRQVLLNLVGNACKFTADGAVIVRVAGQAADGRRWLSVDVADTGIGMSPDQVAGLFAEFVQADASTTRRFGGTGLGLAISHRFCRLLGGSLSAASEPGRGSTFSVRLPDLADRLDAAAAPPGAVA